MLAVVISAVGELCVSTIIGKIKNAELYRASDDNDKRIITNPTPPDGKQLMTIACWFIVLCMTVFFLMAVTDYFLNSTPIPVWSEWSSWSTNAVVSSATREVEIRQANTVVGYNMVHYGTQQAKEPYYRMFRDYSIKGNFDKYGARDSYGEKHFTKFVTSAQMTTAKSFPPDGSFVILFYNNESYEGFQMGNSMAYNFGDDNKIWYIESEDYSVTTQYRYRDLLY